MFAVTMIGALTACGGGGGGSSSVSNVPESITLQLTIDNLSMEDSSGKAVIPTGLPKEGTLIMVSE
jgi:hypothetical protein